MTKIQAPANGLALSCLGWKAYNLPKKKAMEQKFSWSGLVVSLSIAFFIILIAAQALNLIYQSLEAGKNHRLLLQRKIYYLEQNNHLNQEVLKNPLTWRSAEIAYYLTHQFNNINTI